MISKIDKEISLHLRSNIDTLRINTKTVKLRNKSWKTKVLIKSPTIELKSIDLLESLIKLDKKTSLLKNSRFNFWKLSSAQRQRLIQELMNWLKLELNATLKILQTSLSEKKSSFKRDLLTNKRKLVTTNTTLFLGSEKLKLEVIMKSVDLTKELIFWILKSTITIKDVTVFNNFSLIKRNPFPRLLSLSMKLTQPFKKKNTIWTNLMVNLDISKVKMNNTKTLKLNYSKLTNMSIFKAKNTNWDIKNLLSFFRKPIKMNNLLLMKLIDWSLTLNKCTLIKLSFKLKLLLLTNTWLILTIKITAFKKSLKVSLRLMIK